MFRNIRIFVLVMLGIVLMACVMFMSSKANSESNSDKRFNIAMQTVLRHEGGLTNNKNDKGSWTKYGISLRYLILENKDINGDGKIDKNDVIHLTKTDADAIYYKDWYLKHHYNLIKEQTILTDILDMSINSGASQCHKLVTRALNQFVVGDIPVDGVLDDHTIDVLNLVEPVVFHAAFNVEQEKFYKLIVKRNPAYSVFLTGWLKRASE